MLTCHLDKNSFRLKTKTVNSVFVYYHFIIFIKLCSLLAADPAVSLKSIFNDVFKYMKSIKVKK